MSESLAEARSHNIAPEIFLRHYRAIREATTKKDEANALLRVAKKDAKTAGVNLDALRMLEKLANMDADEAALQLRQVFQYANWAELSFGTQAGLFAQPDGSKPHAAAQADHQEWVAGDVGRHAGREGHERGENPHEPGTREHVAWDKGWSEGFKLWTADQKRIANRMGRNAKRNGEASSTRKAPAKKGATRKGARGNGEAAPTTH